MLTLTLELEETTVERLATALNLPVATQETIAPLAQQFIATALAEFEKAALQKARFRVISKLQTASPSQITAATAALDTILTQ